MPLPGRAIRRIGEATITEVAAPDGPVTVGARPEHLQLHTAYVEGMVPARVDFVEPLGSHALVTALVDGDTRVVVQAAAGTMLESGARIGLSMPPERTYFFDATTGEALRSRERITL